MNRLVQAILMTMISSPAISMSVIQIPISGMTCANCTNKISKKLQDIQEIERVQVDFDEQRARIALTRKNVNINKKIKQIIIEAGHTPGEFKLLCEGDDYCLKHFYHH